MKYAVIESGRVVNIALADGPLNDNWIEIQSDVEVGWEYTNGEFSQPYIPPAIHLPKFWSAFDFYRKFTSQERIAIRTLAKTDPIAEDFLHTLDAAIASKSNVRADDQDTIMGLSYLVSQTVLTQERMDEILL